jgi:3-isopropylmalate dehydrogenase
MNATIAVLAGDGIGVDVTAEALKTLAVVGELFNHTFAFPEGLIGGQAIDQTGQPLPPETLALCQRSDAIILGAIGGPKWDDPRAAVRPEQGLLGLRKGLGLFANLRPVKIYPGLLGASTLEEDVISGVDLLVVRELTGGLYFGQPSKRWDEAGTRYAVDTLIYSEGEVERVVQMACDLARQRRKKVTSVDKQNVLSSSRLWREVAKEALLTTEGKPVPELFFITRGNARMALNGEVIMSLGPGTILGEKSFFCGGKASATVSMSLATSGPSRR